MTTVATANETFTITEKIRVKASLERTFASLLEEMGARNQTPDGTPLPMVIEPRPGGRWFRDLGGDNGHFWGQIQAIKRPTLLEITGPLFMSYPVISNVQYRLTEISGGTLITFRHSAFGFIPDEFRDGMPRGWTPLLERVRRQAEARRGSH